MTPVIDVDVVSHMSCDLRSRLNSLLQNSSACSYAVRRTRRDRSLEDYENQAFSSRGLVAHILVLGVQDHAALNDEFMAVPPSEGIRGYTGWNSDGGQIPGHSSV